MREISQIRWITKTVFFSQLTKNFTNIPDFRFPDLFNYLVGKDPVYNSESLKSYKSLLEYELFFDGHVEEFWYHPPQPNGNYSYFKFAVKPTEKSKTDDGSAKYRGFFILKKDGSVNSAYCLCKGGADGSCQHIAAALFDLEANVRFNDLQSCTSGQCMWKKRRKRNEGSLPIQDLQMSGSNSVTLKDPIHPRDFNAICIPYNVAEL